MQALVNIVNNGFGSNYDYVTPSQIPLGQEDIAVGLIFNTDKVTLQVRKNVQHRKQGCWSLVQGRLPERMIV